jgi:membrane protein implicated in regulation of membrane protease activity
MYRAILTATEQPSLPSFGICAVVWLVLVLVFFIAELISLGLTSIWFAAGALVAGIAAMFGAPIWLQCVLFILVTTVTLASTRKLAKRFLDNRLEKTNVEGLIGRTSMVIETIDNAKGTGKIKIRDIEWSARSVEETQVIPSGTKIMIRDIQGVRCMVEPVQKEES